MKFYNKIHKASPITLWQVLTSEVFSFSPFLQLALVLCLSYIPLKRRPEAAKGNLLMPETTRALRALPAPTAPVQPALGLPPLCPWSTTPCQPTPPRKEAKES